MRNPVQRGEACGALVHRPSLGGTPTDGCPCPRAWFGAAEDDPYLQSSPVQEPTPGTLTLAAMRGSWWDQHQARVNALHVDMDRLMEPYRLHGPCLEPFLARRPSESPDSLGHDAPRVRFVCPSGHLVDDVRAHRSWDGDSEDDQERWQLRSCLKWNESQSADGRGIHAAAPWQTRDQPTVGVALRNRARCRNTRCRYDGEKTLEDLLKLYAAAVKMGLRQVQFKD